MHLPIRTCLGCNQKKYKFSLIRFTVDLKSGELAVDPGQRNPGRGYYLCPDLGCISGFVTSRRLRRRFSGISLSQKTDFQEEMKAIIQPSRAQSLVGLARKAGKVAVGTHAVETALGRRKARLLIVAEDVAVNTKARVSHLARENRCPIRIHGRKSEWGRVLGRDSVGVLAILHDHFARAIQASLE